MLSILRARRCGFTLIEMLVSLVVTLMMMAAVVTLFQTITDTVTGSRSVIEMSERLRHVRNVLQADLEGATATMQPPLRPENDEGYFEYIEGPYTDTDWLKFAQANPNNGYWVIGDNDDVLMFTTRTKAEPFVGKLSTSPPLTVESQVAEVMYYLVPNGQVIDASTTPLTRLYTLYRRVLIVKPGLRNATIYPSTPTMLWYDSTHVSAHLEQSPPGSGTWTMVPNTLGDLTKPENRFAHYSVVSGGAPPGAFPYLLNATIATTGPTNPPSSSSAYLVPFSSPGPTGDDVLMTNVLAFDVQIYDPGAPVQVSSSVAVGPTDLGWVSGPGVTSGAYVDLGYRYTAAPGANPAPSFNSAVTAPPPRVQNGSSLTFPCTNGSMGFLTLPQSYLPQAKSVTFSPPIVPLPGGLNPPVVLNPVPPSPLNSQLIPYVYDTWSMHYESNGGSPENTFVGTDKATDGLDSDGNGLIDDIGEYETLAPFPARMRGIRVIIRAYEPSSQQVRQVTVVQDFLPE